MQICAGVFDLIIISSPKFGMVLCFPHQMNELLYTFEIACIIWTSIPVSASALSTFKCRNHYDSVKELLPSDPELRLVFKLQNNEQAVCSCHSASCTLNIYRAVIYVDIPFVCPDTHIFDPCALAPPHCPGK